MENVWGKVLHLIFQNDATIRCKLDVLYNCKARRALQ